MKYTRAYDIACQVRESTTWRAYFDGVERAAALAAANCATNHEVVRAMGEVFGRYEIVSPRWDGSIA